MQIDLHEWLDMLVRWFHVLAGVTWIGQTYLFNWMEATFTPSDDPSKKNVSGQLWMVHGGGFYLVQKQKVPELVPRALHWFKWESALTWLSGLTLLIIVYYTGGALVELESGVSTAKAAGISLALLAGGFAFYDLLWSSPIAKSEPLGVTLCCAALLAVAYLLPAWLSPRAVFLQVGAIFGTIMAFNVWWRILPAQDQMLAAVKRGEKPDMTLALRAKQCSRHNTYMSVPVVLLMISNHFPTATFNYDWRALGGFVLVGFVATAVMRGDKPWWVGAK